MKLQYIFYKERAGIRPGQISKMQKLAGKVGFLAKAVEDADYEGVKEFASDMKKLGVPLEHAPQVRTLIYFSMTFLLLHHNSKIYKYIARMCFSLKVYCGKNFSQNYTLLALTISTFYKKIFE